MTKLTANTVCVTLKDAALDLIDECAILNVNRRQIGVLQPKFRLCRIEGNQTRVRCRYTPQDERRD